MRITRPTDFYPATTTPTTPLVFTGSRGEKFQISVLEDAIIRVEHWPDGKPRLNRTWTIVGKDGDAPREGRRRDDLSPFSLPDYDLIPQPLRVSTHGEREQILQTKQLQIKVNLGDFRIEWATTDGRPLAADLRGRAYEYDREGKTIFHYMERRVGEHYYGFGETSGPLDKYGSRIRLNAMDAMGYNAETGDPLYKHVPFYITLVPELNIAYGLFYDNFAPTTFDMGKEISAFHGFYRYYKADGGDLDYYMIYGPTIAEVVEKFSKLIGRIALPPRWSLGYLGSTMVYTEAPDAAERLKQFVDLCEQHKIPCDLFHLSSGYGSGADGKRYVFTWNRSKVPDPQALSDHFHKAGIRLAANIKPWLLTTHPRYEEVKAAGGFIQSAEGDGPQVDSFWSGGAFQSAAGSYFDFSSEAGYDWWKAGVTDQLLDYGIDSTWNDNNEYEIWDDAAQSAGFGEPIPVGLSRPLQTLLMARASYEAQQAHKPDERPYLISRSGCPGIQRYAQSWSGDNETSWHSLRWNIPMGLGSSLSGLPNTGHDVGGFYGEKPSPELFVRWVQNGILHPRFTIHSFHTDGSVNEPWMYPETLPIIRELFEFRYRLMPYLYWLMWEAHKTGKPIIRPLVYAFQDDPHTHTESFDYMLGDNLLVASVVEEGARERSVYLPAGRMWCDFWTGDWYEGGQSVTVAAPLERIPLFVPDGGMIPMGKAMKHVGAEADDLRQIYAFPHPKQGHSSFTLIEDDGISLGYQRDEYTEVRLELEAAAQSIILKARRQHSGYALPYTDIEFILPKAEKRHIFGEVVGIEWDSPDDNLPRTRIPVQPD
jgi:alpha-glucosidase